MCNHFGSHLLTVVLCVSYCLGGIIGSLLGSLISVIIALLQNNFKIIKVPEDVYFMDFIPLDVNLFDIFIIFIIVSIASVLASSWPSFRAANINTARALKYE